MITHHLTDLFKTLQELRVRSAAPVRPPRPGLESLVGRAERTLIVFMQDLRCHALRHFGHVRVEVLTEFPFYLCLTARRDTPPAPVASAAAVAENSRRAPEEQRA